MPQGVEHLQFVQEFLLWADVHLAVMPQGVEHNFHLFSSAHALADAVKLYHMDLVAVREDSLAEGEARGKAKVLLELLTLRFGPLTEATRARVESAAYGQLDTWVERVLSAQTLDEVLAP